MARRGQTAVAVHRPGLLFLRPKRANGAAHRPRIRPRMILAEQLRKTNRVGIQVGAQKIIGAGSNKVYHCIETHGRGANLLFELTVVGLILFPARTGADAIVSVVTSNS